ncbi:MAG: hypothetical protein ACOC44_02310 [Promethearchaeia archaeon]
MSEEPQLPPIPDIGKVLDRKDRFINKVYSVIKCDSCQATFSRDFKKGDYTFKKLEDEECDSCKFSDSLKIIEIYSEWIDPKKQKDKKPKKE